MDIQAIIFKIIEEINPVQLGILIAFGWYFYRKLDLKLKKIEDYLYYLELRLDHVHERMQRIEIHIETLDKRLFIVETLLHMKECCMLKSDAKEKAQ